MTFRSLFRLTASGLTLVALLTLATTSTKTQNDPLGGRPRGLVAAVGLPGIDRGIRDLDAPREPRGRSTASVQRPIDRGSHQPFVSGSIIVKFRESDQGSAIQSAMRAFGGTAMRRPSHADFDIVAIPADADPEAVSAELRIIQTSYTQPRYVNHATISANDTFYDRQWNFHAIDMERAWDVQPRAGSDIIVAVLDSGVAYCSGIVRYNSRFSYRPVFNGPVFPALGLVDVPFAAAPELAGGASSCESPAARFVRPRDFIWDDELPVDLDGHGTHVTGTIGQLTNNGVGVAGMAYNVRIMPVKVLSEFWDDVFDSPNIGTDDVVARAVRYAVDNGANVINMSLGREGGGPATAVHDAIRYAVSRGAFVAVTAGNTADVGNAAGRIAEAAPTIDGMVAVAAVGRALERAYYSTTNSYVEVAAPGGDQRRDGGTGGILQQTLNLDFIETYLLGPQRYTAPRADSFAYYYFQGTSMAAPHASALAAMLMQQGIRDPAAIEAAMKQFALDLGRPGVDTEYGAGLIQPRGTLRGLGLAR